MPSNLCTHTSTSINYANDDRGKVEIIFSYNWRTQVLGTFDDVTLGFSFKYLKQIYANKVKNTILKNIFKNTFICTKNIF